MKQLFIIIIIFFKSENVFIYTDGFRQLVFHIFIHLPAAAFARQRVYNAQCTRRATLEKLAKALSSRTPAATISHSLEFFFFLHYLLFFIHWHRISSHSIIYSINLTARSPLLAYRARPPLYKNSLSQK